MFAERKFQGAGVVSGRPYGTTEAMIDFGHVQAADLGGKFDTKSLPNLRGGGGTAARRQRPNERTLDLTFADFTGARLAAALRATTTDVVAGTVTGEAVTVKLGGVIRLAHVLPSSIVVKDATDTITYALNTAYRRTHNGIEIPATGSGLVDGATLHVSYAYSAQKVLQCFMAPASEWEIHIDGLNDADVGGDDTYTIDIWRWQPDESDKLALINADYSVLATKGLLLPDTSKGTGLSQYMRIKMKNV